MTKELLSEVLGKHIFRTTGKDNYINIQYRELGAWDKFNIYELEHKCKEWAVKEEGYMLSKLIKSEFMNMGTYTQYQVVYKQPNVEYEFFADTEPEAIFKACEWILKQGR